MSTFELSANIDMMFREAGTDLSDRVRAAAAAGVRVVEMFTTSDVPFFAEQPRDIAALAATLQETGVRMWTVITDPRTALINPDAVPAFLDHFRATARDAQTLGCPNVVVPSGAAIPAFKRQVQLERVADALRQALPIAEEYGVTILLEAVNTRVDHPGTLTSLTEDSVAIIKLLDSPRVRVQYDLYHMVVEGEDPATVFPQVVPLVGHVQIADTPGRHEPGTGTIDWPAQLQMIKDAGYTGVIGLECTPSKNTPEAIAYIQGLLAEY